MDKVQVCLQLLQKRIDDDDVLIKGSLPSERQLTGELGVSREHRHDLRAVPFVMFAQVTLLLFAMQIVLRDINGAAMTGCLCLFA